MGCGLSKDPRSRVISLSVTPPQPHAKRSPGKRSRGKHQPAAAAAAELTPAGPSPAADTAAVADQALPAEAASVEDPSSESEPASPAEEAPAAAEAEAAEAAPAEAVTPSKPVPIQLVDPRSFPDEGQREAVLRATQMIDTPPERRFDTITALMGSIFKTPVALITLLVEDRVWFKSRWGPMGACVARDGSWCNWILVPNSPEVLVCEDATQDARFSASPYVRGPPHIRFYAGAPLIGRGGMRYGTLCVIDLKPRAFSAEMYSLLNNFATLAVQELERDMGLVEQLEAQSAAAVQEHEHLCKDLSGRTDGVMLLDVRSMPWRVLYTNDAFLQLSGEGPDSSLPAPSPGTPNSGIAADISSGSTSTSGGAASGGTADSTGAPSDISGITAGQDEHDGAGFWERFEPLSLPGEDPAMGQVEQAMCDRTPVHLYVRCRATGRVLSLVLRPASSDQLFPEKRVGVPNWVPSELATLPQQQPEQQSDYDSTASQPLPSSSFWFAVAEKEAQPAGGAISQVEKAAAAAAAEAAAAAAAAVHSGGKLTVATARVEEELLSGPATPAAQHEHERLWHPSTPLFTFGEHHIPAELEGLRMGPLIGAGSFGKVYRAVWRGSAVAVKVIECQAGSQQEQGALAEAAMSQGLSHPNLVKTLQYTVQRDPASPPGSCVIWILQQLCTHGTLLEAAEKGMLRQERSLTAPPDMPCLLRTLHEVAAGVEYLHCNGIIHRDLTGSNVLLDQAEPTADDPRGFVARIGDFGLAKLAQAGQISTATYGTVTHMPPELLADGLLTPSVDTWSFGVLCWEAYSGARCHAGIRMPAIIYRITSGKGALQLPEDAPAGLKDLVARCMRQEPAERPTFTALLATIDSMLAGHDDESSSEAEQGAPASSQ